MLPKCVRVPSAPTEGGCDAIGRDFPAVLPGMEPPPKGFDTAAAPDSFLWSFIYGKRFGLAPSAPWVTTDDGRARLAPASDMLPVDGGGVMGFHATEADCVGRVGWTNAKYGSRQAELDKLLAQYQVILYNLLARTRMEGVWGRGTSASALAEIVKMTLSVAGNTGFCIRGSGDAASGRELQQRAHLLRGCATAAVEDGPQAEAAPWLDRLLSSAVHGTDIPPPPFVCPRATDQPRRTQACVSRAVHDAWVLP